MTQHALDEVLRFNGVAVIGMAGRFPGATDVDAFWHMLVEGKSGLQDVTEAQLQTTGIHRDEFEASSYVRRAGVLDHVEEFDATYFNLTPREAAVIDPQQRVLLELAVHALENAGHDPARFDGRIGTYAGVGLSSYLLQNIYGRQDLLTDMGFINLLLGNDKSYAATRLAYQLNLQGPAIGVDTACSTSLVAIHLAAKALVSFECDMALAGGSRIALPQHQGYHAEEGSILSPSGHCRAFDHHADGTVFGNGAGIVVLRRLEDAMADGDHILAVIRASAINNDGAAKVGYAAPGVMGQQTVILDALAAADISADTIEMVEAHGTGTRLGDPIEIDALTQAFRTTTARKDYCAIGSVKTNVGHLESAAGVAGLIKAVQCLHCEQIPPSLHFTQPNPVIDFANSPFYVVNEQQAWPRRPDQARRAAVSSFGIGGTNAHVILEETPVNTAAVDTAAVGTAAVGTAAVDTAAVDTADNPTQTPQLILVSAKTQVALKATTTKLADHLRHHPGTHLQSAAFTLQTGRRQCDHRLFAVGRSAAQMADVLCTPQIQANQTGKAPEQTPRIAWLFPGQGSQYVGMAQGLYHHEPYFRKALDRAAKILKAENIDLLSLLFGTASPTALLATEHAQPALVALQTALADMWRHYGLTPTALLGHSIGEISAAYVGGCFALADVLRLAAERGRLMASMPAGAMLAVQATPACLDKDWPVTCAAINGPQQFTISGQQAHIETVAHALKAKGIEVRHLHTSHAFHSAAMDPILESFRQTVAATPRQPPKLSWISNLTGRLIEPDEAMNPDYWSRQLRQTVQFADGLQSLSHGEANLLLELGPGNGLASLARAAGIKQPVMSALRHPRQQREDYPLFLETLGRLWLAGADLHWHHLHEPSQRRRIPLPGYAFQRQRHWVEPTNQQASPMAAGSHATSGKQGTPAHWFYVPSWQREQPLLGTTSPLDKISLIFRPQAVWGDAWSRQLRGTAAGVDVCFGEDLQLGRQSTIRPGLPADWQALADYLASEDLLPHTVVHGWLLDDLDDDPLGNTGLTLGHGALCELMAALVSHNHQPQQVVVLTRRACQVTGNEPVHATGAASLSLAQVWQQERPETRSYAIDLDRADVGPLCAALKLAITENQPHTAIRGGYRWLAGMKGFQMPAPEPCLSQQAVVLITGGLGAVALAMAENLAKTLNARLILTSRQTFPPPDQWATIAATDDHPQQQRARGLQRINAVGGKVLVIQADAADEVAMATAIRQTETQFGGLDGIIHAAGSLMADDYVPVETLDITRRQRQFRAKVTGLQVLHKLTRERPLSCRLVISSLSSSLGGLGYGAYAAANHVVSAFAEDSRHGWRAVDWDAWSFGDTGGGLAKFAMSRSEALATFQYLIGKTCPNRCMVATANPEQRFFWNQPLPQSVTNEQTSERPDLATDFAEPRNDVEAELAEILQGMLGIEKVGIYDDFFALGGHSLLAARIGSRIREHFEVDLPLQALFDNPTIAGVAAQLVDHKLATADDQTLARLLTEMENENTTAP